MTDRICGNCGATSKTQGNVRAIRCVLCGGLLMAGDVPDSRKIEGAEQGNLEDQDG